MAGTYSKIRIIAIVVLCIVAAGLIVACVIINKNNPKEEITESSYSDEIVETKTLPESSVSPEYKAFDDIGFDETKSKTVVNPMTLSPDTNSKETKQDNESSKDTDTTTTDTTTKEKNTPESKTSETTTTARRKPVFTGDENGWSPDML